MISSWDKFYSGDEISRVNTVLIGWVNDNEKHPRFYFNKFLCCIIDSCSFSLIFPGYLHVNM